VAPRARQRQYFIFRCPVCERVYTTLRGVKIHVRLRHLGLGRCPLCSAELSARSEKLSLLWHCAKVGDAEHLALRYLLRRRADASCRRKYLESYRREKEVYLLHFRVAVRPMGWR